MRPLAERGGDDVDLQQHYETAGGKLVALRRSIPQLASPRELRTAASELDEIEWHVESAESLIAGRTPPERPLRDRPALCFFTHEHGLATEDIDLVRPDGTITAVRVCPANARALERGEVPAVSTVHVGGREIPWPAAPTWYGAPGWTLDDLPGTEYQGREIWGRDMPRRDVPLTPREEGERGAGRRRARGVRAGGAAATTRCPRRCSRPATAEAVLDPDDLAAIGGEEARGRRALRAPTLRRSPRTTGRRRPTPRTTGRRRRTPRTRPEPASEAEAEAEPEPEPEPSRAGARGRRPRRSPTAPRPSSEEAVRGEGADGRDRRLRPLRRS